MTVNTIADRITYLGDGATTVFAFNFATPAASFIQVVLTDPTGVITTPSPSTFTVTLTPLVGANPTPTGGQVVYPNVGSPLPLGWQITIVRVLPNTQATSLANQGNMYPTAIEEALDYLTMLDQTGAVVTDRSFKVGPTDPVPAIVPPVATRANQGAFFDALGNLVPGLPPGGGVFISAAMQPVVGAATLAIARTLLGISNPALIITNTYNVTSINERQMISMEGAAFYTVTVGPASGFSNIFWVLLFNNDTRGKTISVDGVTPFILWPGQMAWVISDGVSHWDVSNPGRWKATTTQNFFVDFTNGNDTNDGLSTGAAAFKTIQHAVDTVSSQVDGPFVINLANGTHSVGTGVLVSLVPPGSAGGMGINIVGNTGTPASVIISLTATGGSPVAAFRVVNGAVLTISGVSFAVTGATEATFLQSLSNSTIFFSNVIFGGMTTGRHVQARNSGNVIITGSYHVNGSVPYHIQAIMNGRCFFVNAGTTLTIDVGMTVTTFVYTAYNGIVTLIDPVTNTPIIAYVNAGFVSGQNMSGNYNSLVITSGAGIPGDNTPSFINGSFFT